MRRHWLSGRGGATTLALAAMIALAAASCSRRPLEIGFVGGLTGRQSELGVAGRNGAQLAFEELSVAGGVRGREFKLVPLDDRNEGEAFGAAMDELAARGIRVVIGPFTSAMGVLAADRRDGVLYLSPTVSTGTISGRNDLFLRFMTRGAETTRALARATRERLGLARVRAILDLANAAYAEEYVRDYGERFEELGGHFLEPVTFDSGKGLPAYEELASRLLEGSPQAVLLVTGAADAAMLARRIASRPGKPVILAAGWAVTTGLLAEGGAAVEGAVFTQQYDPAGPEPRFRAFSEAYGKRFGEAPSFSAALAYEAATTLARAYAKTGSLEPGRLKAAILSLEVEGLQEDYRLDAFGDPVKRTGLYEVRDGAYRRLE